MHSEAPDGPVILPSAVGTPLRLVAAATLVLVAGMQVVVGIQVERAGPIVGAVLLLVVAGALVVGRGRRTSVGRGGIHAPKRIGQPELPWSTIAELQLQPGPAGTVRLHVVREGHPATAAVRVATLRRDDAERLLPAVRALAEAGGVPVHQAGVLGPGTDADEGP